MGLTVDGSDDAFFRAQLFATTGLPDGTPVDEMIVGAHRALAEAPSLVITATIDDAMGAVDRPNQPGTVDEWPNWRIPLPGSFEDLVASPLAAAVADVLDQGVRREGGEVYRPTT
jgi:4-alpha-glucanotransferase